MCIIYLIHEFYYCEHGNNSATPNKRAHYGIFFRCPRPIKIKHSWIVRSVNIKWNDGRILSAVVKDGCESIWAIFILFCCRASPVPLNSCHTDQYSILIPIRQHIYKYLIFSFIGRLYTPAEVATIAYFTPNVDISVETVALRSENREGWGERFMDKENSSQPRKLITAQRWRLLLVICV